MNTSDLSTYFDTVQGLMIEGTRDKRALKDLADLVSQYVKKSSEDGQYRDFFLGERAFFTGDYSLASEKYAEVPSLSSDSSPSWIPFALQRARSFLYRQEGKKDEAVESAKKALESVPDDYITLQLLKSLSIENGAQEEAGKIVQQIADVVHQRRKQKALPEENEEGRQKEEVKEDAVEKSLEEREESDMQKQESHDLMETLRQPIGLTEEELSQLGDIFQEDSSESGKECFFHTEPVQKESGLARKQEGEELSADTDLWEERSAEFLEKTEEDAEKETKDNENGPHEYTEEKEDQTEKSSDSSFFSSDLSADFSAMEEAIAASGPLVESSFEKGAEADSFFPLSATDTLHIDLEYSLEEKIAHFQGERAAMAFQESSKWKNPLLKENVFLCLNGWDSSQHVQRIPVSTGAEGSLSHSSLYPILPGYFKQMSGGFYLRWRNQGIVINPGMSFLKNFYERNFSVSDIDVVIITRDSLESCGDVKGIFDLNEQKNTLENQAGDQTGGRKGSPHVINYYLNRQIYCNLTGILHPRFKEERDMLHCLDFYLDSSAEEESIEIAKGIEMFYSRPLHSDHLAIKMKLTDGELSRSLAFLSSVPWFSGLSSLCRDCDLVVAGFGCTKESDYSKQHYQKDYLGYLGSISLLEAAHPSLFLLSELDGAQGDIRLEVVKKMRQEYLSEHSNRNTALLVSDIGFQCDLEKMKVYCSICKIAASPEKTHVIRAHESFGGLQYLCPNCYL